MTQYKEISERRSYVTIVTPVAYTFDDGESIEVEVSHFFPNGEINEEEIQKGIANRGVTEELNHNELKAANGS